MILESEWSLLAERNGFRSAGQAGFWKGFPTLDHILNLRALVDVGRAHNKTIYCCFAHFRKALDSVPCTQLMQQLGALDVPVDVQFGIYALYESVSGKAQPPNGMSETIASRVGVKQGSNNH